MLTEVPCRRQDGTMTMTIKYEREQEQEEEQEQEQEECVYMRVCDIVLVIQNIKT